MNKIHQHFVFFLVGMLPCLAAALPPGPILGIQLGETNTHLEAYRSGLESADIRNFAFNGRAFIGTQVTNLLGYEIGYLRIRNIRVLNINNSNENGTITQRSVDFLSRINWHFAPSLDLVGRFGASYLIAKPSHVIRNFSTNDYTKHRIAHYRPTFGLGLSYKAELPIGIEASWIHLMEHRALPKLDFIALGLTLYTSGL
jgi:OmpA-like transmembrane domain